MFDKQLTNAAILGRLASGQWFGQLPQDVQEQMVVAGRQRQLAAGCMLFQAGDEPTGLHGVIDGQLHVTGAASSGDEKLMAIHRSGDWTGFLSSVYGNSHLLTATAAIDCHIFTVQPLAVARIFERDVKTFRFLIEPELRVSRRNYRWLIEMTTRPALQRIAERLVDLSRWTHGELQEPACPIEYISQEDLAGACSVSRQTMNSVLNELEAQGFIKLSYGRIDILDSVGLQALTVTYPTKFS